MNRIAFVGLVVLALVPAFAAAHPPAADPHHSCIVRQGRQGAFTPPVLVQSTLSYLAPLGTSPLPCQGPEFAEFGSHAAACPPPPFVGPIAGAYCGPVVAAGVFGGTATCTWRPVFNTLPTGLVIGYDSQSIVPLLPPTFNGLVRLTGDNERPVFGPFPPGSWQTSNPYPLHEGRVIAFPTNTNISKEGKMAPGDLNEIICVTP